MYNTPSLKGLSTKERLLSLAEKAVLAKGFAATSIDELIVAAGSTKSNFFYHFRSKADLAKALMLRYLRRDQQMLDEMCRRADVLHDDPLHGFLVGLKLFAEMMENLEDTHPGLIAASVAYQDNLFDRDIRALNAEGVLAWRSRFRERFRRIAARHPPRRDVDLDALADSAATIVQGGLVLARALEDRTILSRQILLFRDHVRSIFADEAQERAA